MLGGLGTPLPNKIWSLTMSPFTAPSTNQHPCPQALAPGLPDSGVAWAAPSGPFLTLSRCSRQSTPGHAFISALLCPLPSRGTQGTENTVVPQLPGSVQALSTHLTFPPVWSRFLSWGQEVGLQGPNHRFPAVFLPLKDAGMQLCLCNWEERTRVAGVGAG